MHAPGAPAVVVLKDIMPRTETPEAMDVDDKEEDRSAKAMLPVMEEFDEEKEIDELADDLSAQGMEEASKSEATTVDATIVAGQAKEVNGTKPLGDHLRAPSDTPASPPSAPALETASPEAVTLAVDASMEEVPTEVAPTTQPQDKSSEPLPSPFKSRVVRILGGSATCSSPLQSATAVSEVLRLSPKVTCNRRASTSTPR